MSPHGIYLVSSSCLVTAVALFPGNGASQCKPRPTWHQLCKFWRGPSSYWVPACWWEMFSVPPVQQTTINEPVLCDCRFPLPLSFPFLPFPLSPSFHLQTHFPHHNSCYSTLPPLSSRSPLFLYLSLVGGFAFGPHVCGGPLVSCRYVVTMWHSWTHLGLWMLIWIRAFPLTLLRHRINLVRSYKWPTLND